MPQLSDHFTYRKLLRYTFPSIVMLLFTSLYCVVDGFFVANFTDKTAFAAVNFIWPYLMILGCPGFMFGAGGSALIAKTLGEQSPKKAREIFSMLLWVSLLVGVALTVWGLFTVGPLSLAMGAEGNLLEDCVVYGRIYLLATPACLLQYEFQYLCSTAGRPKLGLWVTVAAGVTNMVLDALFVAVFSWGVAGAAAASAVSQYVGGFVPFFFFVRKDAGELHLVKAPFDLRSLGKICSNGASELLSNVSMSVVGIFYNLQLMRYVGEDGVAAYGVLLYVCLIFLAVYIGYSVGAAPVISYHFGAKNYGELKSLLRKSLVIISISAVAMFAASELLAKPLTILFAASDPALMEITLRGFLIYSFSFLFAGFAIFGSSFFTALNNGLVSAIISFLRTVVFETPAVLTFPLIWDVDGIWLSTVGAEAVAAGVSMVFVVCLRKKYKYGR